MFSYCRRELAMSLGIEVLKYAYSVAQSEQDSTHARYKLHPKHLSRSRRILWRTRSPE